MAPLFSPPRASNSFCCEVPPSFMYAYICINARTYQHQYEYTSLYISVSISLYKYTWNLCFPLYELPSRFVAKCRLPSCMDVYV